MRVIRTARTNGELELEGAGPEHNLPVYHGPSAGAARIVEAGDPCYHKPFVASVWEPDPAERAALATGRNIELVILSRQVPAVALGVTDEAPADAPPQRSLDVPSMWFEIDVALGGELASVIRSLERRALEDFRRAEPPAGFRPMRDEDHATLRRLTDLAALLEDNIGELQAQHRAQHIAAGDVEPIVGEGADGARRSAQIAADELATLGTGDADAPARRRLELERDAWLQRAQELEP